MHVLGNARRRVERDGGPHRVDVLLGRFGGRSRKSRAAFAPSTSNRSCCTAVLGQPHVVEHRAGIEQFGVEPQPATLAPIAPNR